MFDDLTINRFWSKVDIRTAHECWPWLGNKLAKDGRGLFSVKSKTITAPRVSLMIHSGIIPDVNLHACHTCDNPNCVNPSHLWWGTNQENLRDAANKGRLPLQKNQFCKSGHPFDEENTRYNGRGNRQCRACHRKHQMKYKQKLRAALTLEQGRG